MPKTLKPNKIIDNKIKFRIAISNKWISNTKIFLSNKSICNEFIRFILQPTNKCIIFCYKYRILNFSIRACSLKISKIGKIIWGWKICLYRGNMCMSFISNSSILLILINIFSIKMQLGPSLNDMFHFTTSSLNISIYS